MIEMFTLKSFYLKENIGNVCSLINPKQLDSILQRTFTDHRQT